MVSAAELGISSHNMVVYPNNLEGIIFAHTFVIEVSRERILSKMQTLVIFDTLLCKCHEIGILFAYRF